MSANKRTDRMAGQQQELLEFWFSDRIKSHWFKSSPEIDAEIKLRFLPVHKLAAGGALENWTETASDTLALVILLDQFTRNIYRGTPAAYANDEQARVVARGAIDAGFDENLDDWRKAFLYMPFMHSEQIDDQDYSVHLFTRAGLDNARYALHHRDIIRRFGRFPHRNRILGRRSTAAELDYLASDAAFQG